MQSSKSTLHLSLKKEPFEVMVSGEKNVEFRKPSQWIKSRLFNSDGSRKEYDVVKFVNGYGSKKPSFTAIFNGFSNSTVGHVETYSNGLKVQVERGDFKIHLGDIIKKENLQ